MVPCSQAIWLSDGYIGGGGWGGWWDYMVPLPINPLSFPLILAILPLLGYRSDNILSPPNGNKAKSIV